MLHKKQKTKLFEDEQVYSYCSKAPPSYTVKRGEIERGWDTGIYTKNAYRHRHRNFIVR